MSRRQLGWIITFAIVLLLTFFTPVIWAVVATLAITGMSFVAAIAVSFVTAVLVVRFMVYIIMLPRKPGVGIHGSR